MGNGDGWRDGERWRDGEGRRDENEWVMGMGEEIGKGGWRDGDGWSVYLVLSDLSHLSHGPPHS